MTLIPIDSIMVSERHRRDLGDIDAFARNIAEIGLLYPVVVLNGGPPWTPREPLPPEAAAADDDGLDIPAFLRRNGGAR
jgi:hypothetical protein